jgi:hypothetical protein
MSLTPLPGLNLTLKRQRSNSANSSSTSTLTNVNNNVVVLKDYIPITKSQAVNPTEKDIDADIAQGMSASPSTVSVDFMKALIRIQTELLLDDISLLNNLRELGTKVIYRVKDLEELIEILTGCRDIRIETEEPEVKCGCRLPLYTKIKSIALNKTTQFLNSDVATRLQEEFKISLEFAINKD